MYRFTKFDLYEEDKTDLIFACKSGNTKKQLKQLKELTIDINTIGVQGNNGKTALMWACIRNNTELALTLIKTGYSNPGVQDNDGETALMYAIDKCEQDNDIILALIATGQSNPGATNKYGETALILACNMTTTSDEIKLALIATGQSNPGARCSDGFTALICACSIEFEENIALAIIATGDFNLEAKDDEEKTAYDYAKENKMVVVLQELAYLRRRYAILKTLNTNNSIGIEIDF